MVIPDKNNRKGFQDLRLVVLHTTFIAGRVQSDEYFGLVSLLFPTGLKVHVLTVTSAFRAPVIMTLFPSVTELQLFDIGESPNLMCQTGFTPILGWLNALKGK